MAEDAAGIGRTKAVSLAVPLVATLLASFDSAVRGADGEGRSPMNVLIALVLVVCAMAWIRADARQLGRSWTEWKLFVFFLGCIAVPVWLVTTRGRLCLPALGAYAVYCVSIGFAGAIGVIAGTLVRG